MLANRPEFPLFWLALARLGACLVPINVKYRRVDTEHVLRDSGAVAVITDPGFAELLGSCSPPPPVWLVEDLPARDGFQQQPIDPAAVVNLQYTSGTTGPPKGCLLSHEYWTVLGTSLITGFPHLTEHDVMLT